MFISLTDENFSKKVKVNVISPSQKISKLFKVNFNFKKWYYSAKVISNKSVLDDSLPTYFCQMILGTLWNITLAL